MAKRKYSKRSKIEPAVTNITVSLSAGRNYIDLSQIASLCNRRAYRQGINWGVAGFKIYKPTPTETGASGVIVSKLPNTWVLSNAWEKAMRSWNKMNMDALETSPSVRPKFLDFKIYMTEEHHQAGFGANALPQTTAGVIATPGEWFASKVVIPVAAGAVAGAVNEFEFVAIGQNYPGVSPSSGLNAISLIEGYANSRSLPYTEDPNVPDDAADADNNTPENWIAAMFNEGTSQTDEVLDVMINENNQPPYPFENDGTHVDTMYPGGQNQLNGLELVDTAYFNAGTNANTLRLKGDNFPCGLIEVICSEECGMIIDLIPGSHRGYFCEDMKDM